MAGHTFICRCNKCRFDFIDDGGKTKLTTRPTAGSAKTPTLTSLHSELTQARLQLAQVVQVQNEHIRKFRELDKEKADKETAEKETGEEETAENARS